MIFNFIFCLVVIIIVIETFDKRKDILSYFIDLTVNLCIFSFICAFIYIIINMMYTYTSFFTWLQGLV